MSWQEFVDQQILAAVPCKIALIAGLEDGTIWAKKEQPGAQVTTEELKTIGKHIRSSQDVVYFQQNGIILGGEKYFCITAEQNLVRGRKSKNAACIVAANSCLIVAVCEESETAGSLNKAVENLGDYLKNSGY